MTVVLKVPFPLLFCSHVLPSPKLPHHRASATWSWVSDRREYLAIHSVYSRVRRSMGWIYLLITFHGQSGIEKSRKQPNSAEHRRIKNERNRKTVTWCGCGRAWELRSIFTCPRSRRTYWDGNDCICWRYSVCLSLCCAILFCFFKFSAQGGVAEWVERWSRLANFPYPAPDYSSRTDDHFVGQTSAIGQPTWPTQPSITQGSVNE